MSPGDTVLKDSVLVTRKIPTSSKPNIRYLQADAKVYARIWYEKKEKFSRISTVYNKTDNKKTLYTIKAFGKEIPLFHKNNAPFKHFEISEKKHELNFFGKYLGITLFAKEYNEVIPKNELHTEESIVSEGIKKLKEKIENEALPDSKIISYEDHYEVLDETTVEVSLKAEYLEDIAIKIKAEK